ncbi:MAG TPA: hypothetical protein VJM15_06870 [Sphingomicrobium sp.]|nr:hypothetical protein [Sphingomicrobium sp.]
MASRTHFARQAGESPFQPRSLSEVVKFTALAALLAIFLDAAIAHAMLWGNDPYWTYWVTDTLLMATVFGIGTMLFGIGMGRGAIITAVHVLALTIYYWTLSPIGLPSQPEWLDLERTWITGLPVHLAVYYMGYLGALWLWGRRRGHRAARDPNERSLGEEAVAALAVAAGIVIVTGLAQTLLFQEFMGLTWFVMRIAVAVPFIVAWWALAGNDGKSAALGGITLALLLTTYSHYLGPVGLPTEPARLWAENAPPAEVHWLSYSDTFLVMLPLTTIIAIAGFVLASRWFGKKLEPREARGAIFAGAAAAAVLVVLGALTAPGLGADASRITVNSTGPASSNSAQTPVPATLQMTVANRNTHRTHSPPHDFIDLAATVPGAGGETLEIRSTQPMVAEPAGRFTTFAGIGFGEWHDGRSGIGMTQQDAIKSNVVGFALADVRANGRLVATRVPLQVSAVSKDPPRLDLHLAGAGVAQLPDSLHVSWAQFEAGDSNAGENARYLFGGGVLLVLFGFMFAAALAQRRAWREDQVR